MEKIGIRDKHPGSATLSASYLCVLLLGVLHLIPERNDHVHLLHPDGLNLQAVSL